MGPEWVTEPDAPVGAANVALFEGSYATPAFSDHPVEKGKVPSAPPRQPLLVSQPSPDDDDPALALRLRFQPPYPSRNIPTLFVTQSRTPNE